MAEIAKVFPQVSLPIQDVESSQEAEAKTLVDWSLNPPCMVRIGGDGFTEIAAMESPQVLLSRLLFSQMETESNLVIFLSYTFELHLYL